MFDSIIGAVSSKLGGSGDTGGAGIGAGNFSSSSTAGASNSSRLDSSDDFSFKNLGAVNFGAVPDSDKDKLFYSIAGIFAAGSVLILGVRKLKK